MGIRELLSYTKNLNLLYAEDEEISQALYAAIFEDIFLNIDIANDGQEALDFYTKNHYDLVISDICMPRMDCVELSREILQIKPDQHIIIMTAFNEKAQLDEISKMGVTDVLLKPVQNDYLMNVLEKVSKVAYIQQQK